LVRSILSEFIRLKEETMMAAALAMDLRTRVIKDVEGGLTVAAAAAKYSVSARTIFQWKSLLRERGSCQPRAGKTGPQPKLEGFREQILELIRENSGITLAELKATLELPVSLSTVWLTLKTWGIVLKKSPGGGGTAAA
jgi:transposase